MLMLTWILALLIPPALVHAPESGDGAPAVWRSAMGEVEDIKAWMKRVMEPAARAKDVVQLRDGFHLLAVHAPGDDAAWRALAADGAAAAAAQDFEGVRRACLMCHMKLRRRYRAELVGQPWPPAPPHPDASTRAKSP